MDFDSLNSIVLRGLLLWLGLALLEVIHGITRAKFLAPRVGDLKSRQIGVASGSLLILVYTWCVFPLLTLSDPLHAWIVGGIWLVCMVLFELIVGHFVFHFSWKWLMNDFNIFKGRLLAIGMLILALAPWLIGRLRGVW